MTLHNPLWLQAVTGDTAITYSATDDRGVISALAPNAGVILAGDLAVTQRAAGANMSVDVAAGRAIIKGTSVSNQGTYIVFSDATMNVPIAPADPTYMRIDAIVYRVYDKQSDGGTAYGSNIYVVAGTPSANPAQSALPPNSLRLAQIIVPAASSSVTTQNVYDKRTLSGSGDVPKWDMANTTGTAQTIPGNAETVYKPGTHFQSVGVTVDPTFAAVTILTPGRYVVHFSARMSPSSASGPRTAFMRLYDTDGTTVLRNIGNTVVATTREPISVAGTMYIAYGQTVKAELYQNTGQTLSVDDGFLDNDFTGVWVGP